MRNTFNLILFALYCTAAISLFSGCEEDPCEYTVCLNGGTCSDGSCICPTGFSGENCETDNRNTGNNGCNTCRWANDGECDEPFLCDVGTDCNDCQGSSGNQGYDCVNGNCQSVSNNPSYSTLTACQNACSSTSTSGYVCNGGSCSFVNQNATYGSLQQCENSCGLAQIMVFSVHPTPCTNSVDQTMPVYVNDNYVGTITRYFDNPNANPECGHSIAITVEVAPGTYNIRAECENNNWTSTVQVTGPGCNSVRISP